MGLPPAKIDQIQFAPLTEFGSALTPNEQAQLVQSWMSGAISHMTVLSNFRKAGILGEGRTEADELNQLQAEANDPNDPTNRIATSLTQPDRQDSIDDRSQRQLADTQQESVPKSAN